MPHFDSCKGNPLCFQLPWERDSAMFDKWRRGMTGYPWIDAAMRQMRTEGWIHHCLRCVWGCVCVCMCCVCVYVRDCAYMYVLVCV